MNKQQVLSVLFIVWMCLIAGGASAEEVAIKPNQEIQIGEHLEYRITWLKIPVAIGELWAKEKIMLDGREVIHVVGIIGTNKVLRKIFPMHDEAHSWIDAKTFESVQFEKNVDEIKIKAHEKTVFDPKKKKGYLKSLKTGKKKEFKITVPVYDVVSVIYWARRQTLEPGKSFNTVLTALEKDWALELKVVGHEKVKFQGKKIDTLRVEPNTISEGVHRKGMAYFNVTNDSSRLPVRGVYKAIFGSVVGTLKKTEQHA